MKGEKEYYPGFIPSHCIKGFTFYKYKEDKDMNLLKRKKQIVACLCGMCMLFGVGGIVASQQNDFSVTVAKADTAKEIGVDVTAGVINNENTLGRFRLVFDAPICDKNSGTASALQAGELSDLNGLQDKLMIAGKTPTEWSQLDVGFSIAFRTNQVPVFSFDKSKLDALKLNFLNGTFIVSLAEDCVLDNNYGAVKAFAVYATAKLGAQSNFCGTDDLVLKSLEDRPEGPFLYEGVQNGLLQIKMWFDTSIIEANGTSDVNINVEQMEGLQHALYFNGKSLAQWAMEGSLGTVTARAGGGFIFRFDASKYDTSKETFIEIKKELQTTKGVIQPFKYWVKAGFNFGSFNDKEGKPNGNGYLTTDEELANIQYLTADLTSLNLQLCASAADHNLWITFDEKVFSHDGVVASSGQIGVLSNIKLNGKSLHEWYNLNSSGTLDTVAFYPQQECFAVVMQFKLNRMAELFEKDPIYYEDLVIESEELTWKYYEDGQWSVVTIPAFSYTYSQAHGKFFETGTVPEKSEDPLRVKDVSPITTFGEDNNNGHAPGTQVFAISFWKDVCGPNSIWYMPSYETMLDNVALNGKTLREIQETAVDKDGNAMPSGVTVQMGGYMNMSGKCLVIYLNGNLADEFLFKKTTGEQITIKAGFTSKLNDVVAEDVTFEYYQGGWRKVLDTSALEYTDLQVTSISRLQFIGDTINGKRAATFFIYFDRAVSLERLLYVGRNKENLVALKNQGALKVSEEKIYGIVDNHIGDYVLDYIKYDGKTLRETLQAEDTLAMRTWGIDIHYTGDTFDTKAIQITFNAEANCLISDGNTHTFEIMEGFVSPLLGKTGKSYKFELQVDTNGWKNISVGVGGEYPELPKSDYVEPVESGCGSAITSMPLAIVTLAMSAVVVARKRRMKDEE